MKRLRDILMPRLDSSDIPSAILWTSLSGSLYAGASFILLMLASNWTGAYWAGVFGLGIAMSQQLYTLGNFSMGGYQASDATERNSFPEYVASRVITVGAMFPAAIAWILLSCIDKTKAAVFLIVLAQRASEAFCSVFTGRYQQMHRLDVGGRIEFTKNLLSLVIGIIALWLTRNIFISAACSSIVHIVLYSVLDRAVLPDFGGLRFIIPNRRTWQLLLACTPLALTTFLLLYIQNGVRFAVEHVSGTVALAEFNALFMVSFAVSTFASFILNPHVAAMASAREEGNARAFLRIVGIQTLAIGALGIAAIACSLTFGAPLLSILFRLDIANYKFGLSALVVGGVLFAFYQLAQTVLIVLRKQAWTLWCVLPPALATLFGARVWIGSTNAENPIDASSEFFVMTMGLLCVISVVLAIIAFMNDPIRCRASTVSKQ